MLSRAAIVAACVLSLGATMLPPAAAAAPAARSCLNVVFGFRELSHDDDRIEMAGTARSAISGTPIRKVSYDFVGSNSSTGYKRTYRGTDGADSEGGWQRLVYPRVGWGSLKFEYQISATMADGTVCKSNLHTQTFNR